MILFRVDEKHVDEVVLGIGELWFEVGNFLGGDILEVRVVEHRLGAGELLFDFDVSLVPADQLAEAAALFGDRLVAGVVGRDVGVGHLLFEFVVPIQLFFELAAKSFNHERILA